MADSLPQQTVELLGQAQGPQRNQAVTVVLVAPPFPVVAVVAQAQAGQVVMVEHPHQAGEERMPVAAISVQRLSAVAVGAVAARTLTRQAVLEVALEVAVTMATTQATTPEHLAGALAAAEVAPCHLLAQRQAAALVAMASFT